MRAMIKYVMHDFITTSLDGSIDESKKFLKRLLSVLSILIISIAGSYAAKRPNLLFIMMDDLGYGQCQFHNDTLTVEAFDPFFMKLVEEKGSYDPEQALVYSKKAMPTLTRLANEGVVFSRAFAASNLCAPSRISIATGKNQQYRGIYVNVDVEATGPDPGSMLAHKLKDAGYATAHIGKWHMGKRDYSIVRRILSRHGIEEELSYGDIRRTYPGIFEEIANAGYYGSVIPEQNPLRNGFDYYYGYNNWESPFYDSTIVWDGYEHAGRQPGYNTDVFTRKALGFMKQSIDDGTPFFVQLHYHAVHGDLSPKAPDMYFSQFPSDSYDLTNFYAHVFGVDANVQLILDYLDEAGILDDTLIVFTSDNGGSVGGRSVLPGNAPYSGHKGNYFLGGIRVPLFFSWPSQIRTGIELEQMASCLDILPTFLDAAGVDVPQGLDGKSLLPLMTGKSDAEVHDYLVWAGIHAARWGFMIQNSYEEHRTEGWRPPPGWAVLKGDSLLRFVGEIEPKLYYDHPEGAPPRLSLFNITEDQGERKDLAGLKPEIIEKLKELYLKETESYLPPPVWPVEKWKEIAGRAKQ